LIYGDHDLILSILSGLEYELIVSDIETPLITVLAHTHSNKVSNLRNVIILLNGVSGYSVLHSTTQKSFEELQKNERVIKLIEKHTHLTESSYLTGGKLRENTRIREMVSLINRNSFLETATKMASFNRFSFGQGIGQARTWITEEITKLGKFVLRTEEYSLRGTRSFNIIATINGTLNSSDFYIIGAHYDSISQLSGNERVSPGAEDDGSGSAGLIELAKILARFPPKKYYKINLVFWWRTRISWKCC